MSKCCRWCTPFQEKKSLNMKILTLQKKKKIISDNCCHTIFIIYELERSTSEN